LEASVNGLPVSDKLAFFRYDVSANHPIVEELMCIVRR
jgi:hypothetical protein